MFEMRYVFIKKKMEICNYKFTNTVFSKSDKAEKIIIHDISSLVGS